MEHMNVKFLTAWIAPAFLVILSAACNGANPPVAVSPFDGMNEPGKSPGKVELPENALHAAATVPADIAESLERITELERAGGFFPGLGLAESELRERAGDYAGAAVAAYKELSWAYGYGIVSMSQVEEGLHNALALFEGDNDPQRSAGNRAVRGCIAFARGDWELAEELLLGILSPDDEPDSFLKWMLLACALEQDNDADKGRKARSAYGAIRARYALFPEYWYRGARNIGAAYAEQCVNTSPQGPFAENSRTILAAHFGITPDGRFLRTKVEIENILRASVSMNNPNVMEELFPLMALPDNPYTIYALGAMQALSAIPEFRTFFIEAALKASGRLAERLNYISRSRT